MTYDSAAGIQQGRITGPTGQDSAPTSTCGPYGGRDPGQPAGTQVEFHSLRMLRGGHDTSPDVLRSGVTPPPKSADRPRPRHDRRHLQ
jgi:hypothetical protein